MAVQYQFNDIDAAKQASRKAAELSDKVKAVCGVIRAKSAEIQTLNNTFAVNTQVCNRFDQLESVMSNFIEPLENVAVNMKKFVQLSEDALAMGKSGMI